jgi:hypothetical protein
VRGRVESLSFVIPGRALGAGPESITPCADLVSQACIASLAETRGAISYGRPSLICPTGKFAHILSSPSAKNFPLPF